MSLSTAPAVGPNAITPSEFLNRLFPDPDPVGTALAKAWRDAQSTGDAEAIETARKAMMDNAWAQFVKPAEQALTAKVAEDIRFTMEQQARAA